MLARQRHPCNIQRPLAIAPEMRDLAPMARPTLKTRYQKLQKMGLHAANQLTAARNLQRRGAAEDADEPLWKQLAEELGEAGQDIAALLLSGTWRTPPEEVDRRIAQLRGGKHLGEFGVDPFGYAPETLRYMIPLLDFLHRVWFRAECTGLDRVPDGRVLLIANHSGQLPFDGAVIASAMLLEREPPRMPRTMVEKFATALPGFGELVFRCGQVTGLPDNCRRLLENDECVLVFPEGARGIAKPFHERYQMTPFGHGFMRMALETRTPIVPIAVVGAEEQTINLFNFKLLAKLLHAPSFAVTPLMPLLGPLAMLPSPVKYRVYFGEPLIFEGDPNDDESAVAPKVAQVREAIQDMLDRGLAERRGYFV